MNLSFLFQSSKYFILLRMYFILDCYDIVVKVRMKINLHKDRRPLLPQAQIRGGELPKVALSPSSETFKYVGVMFTYGTLPHLLMHFSYLQELPN